jgi:hypothetical protein
LSLWWRARLKADLGHNQWLCGNRCQGLRHGSQY